MDTGNEAPGRRPLGKEGKLSARGGWGGRVTDEEMGRASVGAQRVFSSRWIPADSCLEGPGPGCLRGRRNLLLGRVRGEVE